MQIGAANCNQHLKLSSAPIELAAENLHKHQKKTLEMAADSKPVGQSKIYSVKQLWHSVSMSMKE